MNKELIKKMKEIKELNIKITELINFINEIDNFVNTKGKYYTNDESIEALNKIKEILTIKREEYKIKNDKIIKIKNRLQKSCNHEIIIGDDLNTYCTICKKLIIHVPESTMLEIKLPSRFDFETLIHSNNQHNGKILQDRIFEIIEEGMESENLLSCIEEPLEELQYITNIKIRRLK